MSSRNGWKLTQDDRLGDPFGEAMPWDEIFQVSENVFILVFSCAVVHLYKKPFRKWHTVLSAVNNAKYFLDDAIGSSLVLFRERKVCRFIVDGSML